MTTLKGGDVLMRAASIATRLLGRPVRLVMAGDGPQKEDWRRTASSLGVDAEFTGWVGLDDRLRVYRRGMLVAVPSLWPEPFGLIGLDAAALGRPAVAFDVGGIREWLTDGVNGRLVDTGCGRAGLAEAIVSLLRMPAECRAHGTRSVEGCASHDGRAHVDRLEDGLAQRRHVAAWRYAVMSALDDSDVRISAGLRRCGGLHRPGRRGAGEVRRRGHGVLSHRWLLRLSSCPASRSLSTAETYGRSAGVQSTATCQWTHDHSRAIRADGVWSSRRQYALVPLAAASPAHRRRRVMFHEPYFEFVRTPVSPERAGRRCSG